MSDDKLIDEAAICGLCGVQGAYNFVGELICRTCLGVILKAKQEARGGATDKAMEIGK